MAYVATGTAGNDTLNQSSDTGPGTIVGLAGDDTISLGSGLATVTGDSGNDSILTRTGNTGTISGGTKNDSVFLAAGTGSMLTLGNAGADTIQYGAVTTGQTIVGGDDSSDGPDMILSQGGNVGNDLLFGNGGNDIIVSGIGADTFVGGFGDDSLTKNFDTSADLAFGNQGNDTMWVSAGNDTAFGGIGSDSIYNDTSGNALYFGNEGGDTVGAAATNGNLTVVGGNDSADGADLITTGTGADFVFGNGGNDTINSGNGANTVVAGVGNDNLSTGSGNDLVFLNEGNDVMVDIGGNNTIFGGLGNDCIFDVSTGASTIQGNEGNDTIRGRQGIDTLSGGTGNDVFDYFGTDDDGNNAAGGGPVELITDVNFAEDRFRFANQLVTFAANMGAGTGVDLNTSANNAIAAAFALSGGANWTAAQFTFGGRTYLAVDQGGVQGTFTDANDFLLDITGATGTISAGNFTL